MAVGNKQKMLEINGNYVLEKCHAWCKGNKRTMASLSDELGHSVSYIQASCKAGKMPVAELKVLCDIINIKVDDCILTNHAEELTAMTIDEKLDYLIEMIEDLKKDE